MTEFNHTAAALTDDGITHKTTRITDSRGAEKTVLCELFKGGKKLLWPACAVSPRLIIDANVGSDNTRK